MKLVYFFLFIILMSNVNSFGVSPVKFDFELKNGENIEKEFFIFNENNELKKYNISSYGIDFFNFTSFVVDVKKEKKIEFLIDVPGNASGKHDGRIYVNEIDNNNKGMNIKTLLGIKVNVNVKNQDDDFFETKTKPEIIIFYIFLVVIFILSLWRILKHKS